MKNILICGFLLFFFGNISAQNIADIEQNLSSQSGAEFTQNALFLSEHFYQKKNFAKAKQFAAEAFNEAQKKGDKNTMAVALNREAKAMINFPNRLRINRNRALKKLKLSNRTTNNKLLKESNLELIALVENLQKEDKSGNLFNRKKQQKDTELAELTEVKDDLSETVESLEAQQEELREHQQELSFIVAEKEATLQKMTEEQMLTEFLLMEQKRLADSIAFINEKAAMEQREKEMMEDMKIAELQAQLDLEKEHHNLFLAFAVIAALIAVGLLLGFLSIRKHNKDLEEKSQLIESERQRNEELLLNILPKSVAEELKEKGIANAKRFNKATVLFTDFKDFTKISKQMSPERLVEQLDYCFKAFDQIIGKYGLEKIKTIGDSYMCAGGLPIGNSSDPSDMVRAALDIQAFLNNWKKEKIAKKEPFFEARIGIHTGPIIAGVVGEKKFAYDIWGSTVNVASRMESNSEAGKVNISAATYELIKNDFKCEARGKLMAKNYGEVEMFFVKES